MRAECDLVQTRTAVRVERLEVRVRARGRCAECERGATARGWTGSPREDEPARSGGKSARRKRREAHSHSQASDSARQARDEGAERQRRGRLAATATATANPGGTRPLPYSHSPPLSKALQKRERKGKKGVILQMENSCEKPNECRGATRAPLFSSSSPILWRALNREASLRRLLDVPLDVPCLLDQLGQACESARAFSVTSTAGTSSASGS